MLNGVVNLRRIFGGFPKRAEEIFDWFFESMTPQFYGAVDASSRVSFDFRGLELYFLLKFLNQFAVNAIKMGDKVTGLIIVVMLPLTTRDAGRCNLLKSFFKTTLSSTAFPIKSSWSAVHVQWQTFLVFLCQFFVSISNFDFISLHKRW